MIAKIKEHLSRKALGINLYHTDAELLEEAYYELLMLTQELEEVIEEEE